MPKPLLTRRGLLSTVALGGSATLLSGCDRLSQSPTFQEILDAGEWLNQRVQRLIGGSALAREYTEAAMSPDFRTNGNTRPRSADWNRLAAQNFADWRLMVDGLVEAPQSFSLAELRALGVVGGDREHDRSGEQTEPPPEPRRAERGQQRAQLGDQALANPGG